MTEEEKQSVPKVTKELLARVFSYLTPYWKQMALVLLAIAALNLRQKQSSPEKAE